MELTCRGTVRVRDVNNFFPMNGEIWKPIEGFQDWFEVSNLGRVRKKLKVGYYLKPQCKHDAGYWTVRLIKKQAYVHRLVAMAFIPNPDNKPHVNHKDGNKENPFETNLEWATERENTIHSFVELKRVGGRKGKFGVLCIGAKKIIQCDSNWNEIKTWDSIADAVRFITDGKRTNSGMIAKCIKRKIRGYGYYWKYVTPSEAVVPLVVVAEQVASVG